MVNLSQNWILFPLGLLLFKMLQCYLILLFEPMSMQKHIKFTFYGKNHKKLHYTKMCVLYGTYIDSILLFSSPKSNDFTYTQEIHILKNVVIKMFTYANHILEANFKFFYLQLFAFNFTFIETCFSPQRNVFFLTRKKKRKKNLFYCSFAIINFSILDFIRNLSPWSGILSQDRVFSSETQQITIKGDIFLLPLFSLLFYILKNKRRFQPWLYTTLLIYNHVLR